MTGPRNPWRNPIGVCCSDRPGHAHSVGAMSTESSRVSKLLLSVEVGSPTRPAAPMPELPDVVVYLECLHPRVVGRALEKIRLSSPFLLRSVEPPPESAEGKTVRGLRRLGKRLVF